METISLKLELLNPTEHKKKVYQKMTDLNTRFSNFLLEYKVFSSDKIPSAIVNQTIREVKEKAEDANFPPFLVWIQQPKF